jgi:hypothetical protein
MVVVKIELLAATLDGERRLAEHRFAVNCALCHCSPAALEDLVHVFCNEAIDLCPIVLIEYVIRALFNRASISIVDSVAETSERESRIAWSNSSFIDTHRNISLSYVSQIMRGYIWTSPVCPMR